MAQILILARFFSGQSVALSGLPITISEIRVQENSEIRIILGHFPPKFGLFQARTKKIEPKIDFRVKFTPFKNK